MGIRTVGVDSGWERTLGVYAAHARDLPARMTHVPVLRRDLAAILDELAELRRALGIEPWPAVDLPGRR